ncbi:MAG TPA: DUF1801 domain-containing protein [Saprospiraceae bacterium]|nr:DUF1801 domain-containing protein [Saprospiraceae bacterium]
MNTVEEYINQAPEAIQGILRKVRQIILEEAPNAVESIAYMMPAYKTNGKPLVYFGASKKHLGFYATPTGHSQFEDRLALYKQGKGSVQFPYNKEIPYDLIREIVQFRIQENETISKK